MTNDEEHDILVDIRALLEEHSACNQQSEWCGFYEDVAALLPPECTSDDPTNHQGDTCPVHEAIR